MPVVIQGLGARSKIDAPTAGWEEAKLFVDDATARGASVHSMVMAKPFNRTFTLAAGTTLYEGVPAFDRMFKEARTVADRMALLRDPGYRDAVRWAVENPNKDPDAGPTLPPPNWHVLLVGAGHPVRPRRPRRTVGGRPGRGARRGAGRLHARPRPVGGPRAGVALVDRERRLAAGHPGRGRRSAHGDRRVRRRRPPRPRRRLRVVVVVLRPLGPPLGGLDARGGRPPHDPDPGVPVRVLRPRPAPAGLPRRRHDLRPRHDRPRPQGIRARLPERRGPLAQPAQGAEGDHRERRPDRARRRDHRRAARRRGPPHGRRVLPFGRRRVPSSAAREFTARRGGPGRSRRRRSAPGRCGRGRGTPAACGRRRR